VRLYINPTFIRVCKKYASTKERIGHLGHFLISFFDQVAILMTGPRKTYAALLIAVFFVGGLLGPFVHDASYAFSHGHDDPAHVTSDVVFDTLPTGDLLDCELCEVTMTATGTVAVAGSQISLLSVLEPIVTSVLRDSISSLPLSRAPPVMA